ncbi:organomercurial lyase [Streptomyces colonosanans]|uniref:organomercurial lyase n=1 Tax=Streptomyces colonosanans TaxID=1428652 RepID=UPI002481A5FC|nr:organomercurial lyase [Streptomyces colonosanans]
MATERRPAARPVGGRGRHRPHDAPEARQRPGGGPAAMACCDALNFFTSAVSAQTWASDHPDIPGCVVAQAQAEEIARETFGPLLAP